MTREAKQLNNPTTVSDSIAKKGVFPSTTFTNQKLSVAVHMATAYEIAQAFGISTAVDPRAAA